MGIEQYVPVLALGGLAVAGLIYASIGRWPSGNARMNEVARAIHDGAMAFLRREYQILAVFIAVIFGLLAVTIGLWTGVLFVAGALSSMACGLAGMKAATRANVRTSAAANEGGQRQALLIAFSGGSVMGLSVASLGLLGVSVCFLLFGRDPANASSVATISGFAMGASSIALFARVGGGIYTKTADIGADLVGKVEAGHSRGRSAQPSGHRGQRGGQRGRCRGNGGGLIRVVRGLDRGHHRHRRLAVRSGRLGAPDVHGAAHYRRGLWAWSRLWSASLSCAASVVSSRK